MDKNTNNSLPSTNSQQQSHNNNSSNLYGKVLPDQNAFSPGVSENSLTKTPDPPKRVSSYLERHRPRQNTDDDEDVDGDDVDNTYFSSC
ncbi:hypothetical protein CYY_002111 [Polysphondylium violaceum]|uniref:Uncharacterized protein n=1 Tax=Polysphondylium violaceum TaxID=133409 RepID=A0A8J4V113_9MYCE|nr:hypothetical protein CYY_002111 [Polysphondylium violaceum]